MEQESDSQKRFAREVEAKEARKLRARREGERSIWFGLGMFGMVGWAVALPTLIFLAVGIWIDARFETRFSWTLMLLVVGIALGCLNAWYWIKKESEDART